MFKLIHKSTPGRIEIIDALRGLAILLMVVCHLAYDLVAEGIIPYNWLNNPPIDVLRMAFALLFIVICGVSCSFSHSNLRRGLLICAAALVVTGATYLFDPTEYVKFGILHLLGVSVLIYAAARPVLDRIPAAVTLSLAPVLCAVTWPLMYQRFDVKWLWWLGIMPRHFVSSDYYPLLPYFFAFLFGTALGPIIKARKFPKWFYEFRCAPLAFCGRNTLWIYLIHQPLCIGLTYLILALK